MVLTAENPEMGGRVRGVVRAGDTGEETAE